MVKTFLFKVAVSQQSKGEIAANSPRASGKTTTKEVLRNNNNNNNVAVINKA